MLDPIKVSLLTPGIDAQGNMSDFGIPAPVVTKFLDTQGIVVEKTGDYCILFLFSIGITKGKWGTLVDALFDFKRLFDEGASVEEVFPDLIALDPKRYAGMTVAQLCHQMHTFKKDRGIPKLLTEAFAKLPEPAMTPVAAYRLLVRDQVDQVPVEKMDGRVVAVGVVPYPPGIPIMMPGERAGGHTPAVLEYMTALQDFDNRFPGFEHDSHGVEFTDGQYLIYCIKEGAW